MDQKTEMQKSAQIEHELLDVIHKRRSKRAYLLKAIDQKIIDSLFEAARWAPSANNEQPWVYIYATKDQPLWNKLFETLNDSNKIWAENAPLLVLSVIRKNFLRNDLPNGSAKYDLGAANAFLSLQATHVGLNVRQLGGFSGQKATENMMIPETHEPVIMMAIGYPGPAESLPENLKQRELTPNERYTKSSFVMNTTF
jgi:nitroreductase